MFYYGKKIFFMHSIFFGPPQYLGSLQFSIISAQSKCYQLLTH